MLYFLPDGTVLHDITMADEDDSSVDTTKTSNVAPYHEEDVGTVY